MEELEAKGWQNMRIPFTSSWLRKHILDCMEDNDGYMRLSWDKNYRILLHLDVHRNIYNIEYMKERRYIT